MKIQQQDLGTSTDRLARAGQTGRLGSETISTGSRTHQLGLDSAEVSRVGETAARLVEGSMQIRQQRVGQLASQYQSGSYRVNLASLSHSILNHDVEPDILHAR